MRTSPFVVNFLAAVPFDDTFDPASLIVPAEKLTSLPPPFNAFALAAAVGVGLVGRPTLPTLPLTVYTLLSGATEFSGIAQTCGYGDF